MSEQETERGHRVVKDRTRVRAHECITTRRHSCKWRKARLSKHGRSAREPVREGVRNARTLRLVHRIRPAELSQRVGTSQENLRLDSREPGIRSGEYQTEGVADRIRS